MSMLTASEINRSYTSLGSSNSLAVKLEDISVYYRHEQNRPTSLKEFVIRRIKGDLDGAVIKALESVSLEVGVGEVFGIIGRNGAGKSTLLKVISRIIRPTRGRLRVWGRSASLLGVGAGFHPELTGRENVFLYSAILGRKQSETEKRFNAIVEFAELSDFIDTPIRVYSSGMIARLGFATAMADKPEILLVDEVLGVGDQQFRVKCEARFNDFRRVGTTIIIVSHNMRVIETMSDRALWLHNGCIEALGSAKEVVMAYRKFQTK